MRIIKRLLLIVGMAIGISSADFAYQMTKPVEVSRITLTDGEHTYVVQGMIHVGESAFYQAIDNDLFRFKQEGYKIFYEGVTSGKESLSDYLIGKDAPHLALLYCQLANFIGLDTQYSSRVQGDILADASEDEVIKLLKDRNVKPEPLSPELKARMESLGSFAKAGKTSPFAFLYKKVARVFVRASMEDEGKEASPLDSVVVDFRSDLAVAMATAENLPKVLIQYGEGHVKRIVEDLLKRGLKMSVVRIEKIKAW